MVDLIEQNKADIFTTDVIAAALMASNKSNYSFDVEIKKFGDKIFIDKRVDEIDEIHNVQQDNILDFDTVCETSLDHQPFDDDNINGIWPLMKEAKKINNSFLHNALSKDFTKIRTLEDENPFIEDEGQVATRTGYHYNIWKIQEANEEQGRKEIKICIRCNVHAHNNVTKLDGEGVETMNIYTLFEHNQSISNWRENVDKNLIPCLNKEIQNNGFKISRWLIQSIIAKVDFIKFAFVSRKNFEDDKKHVVLATHTVGTLGWAKQLNMQMEEMWKKLRYTINLIQDSEKDNESETAEFILLKDLQKQSFRLYKKDNDGDDEDEEEEEQIKS